jgi:glucose/mannose-6-phosphate isomerase
MKKLIAEFTEQIKHAIEIAHCSVLSPSNREIKNVIICGMGGSGISGNIVSEAMASEFKIPVIVNKDYCLPNFSDENSLVIISSYSGETEETVKAFDEAISKGSKIVCVTSGGRIGDIAARKNIDLILIPKGFPPRAAIGYSLTQLLYILNYHSVISSAYEKNLLAAIKLIDAEEKNILNDAKETAGCISGKLPIIYSAAGMESVAIRFRQQLNENSKLLCWHNVFPELNHNELQGWREINDKLAVIFFRNANDYFRTSKRIDISAEVISHYDPVMKEIYSKGYSLLERILYLIHWGDWVSYFLAEIKGIDIMDIRVITYLKSELAKVE